MYIPVFCISFFSFFVYINSLLINHLVCTKVGIKYSSVHILIAEEVKEKMNKSKSVKQLDEEIDQLIDEIVSRTKVIR